MHAEELLLQLQDSPAFRFSTLFDGVLKARTDLPMIETPSAPLSDTRKEETNDEPRLSPPIWGVEGDPELMGDLLMPPLRLPRRRQEWSPAVLPAKPTTTDNRRDHPAPRPNEERHGHKRGLRLLTRRQAIAEDEARSMVDQEQPVDLFAWWRDQIGANPKSRRRPEGSIK